jgi:hypothetical protein
VETAASWTRLELSGRTANDTLCQVEVLLLDPGTAWLDAVSLLPVAAAP